MNHLFTWFFDLGSIPEDAANMRLSWTHPLPGWVWFVIILSLMAFSAWSYSRVQARALVRILLGTLRFTSLLLLLVLIAGPQAFYPREVVDQDLVMIMVDRSASMMISDVVDQEQTISRDDQIRELIDRNPTVWSDIADRSDVRWIGFSSGIFDLDTGETTDDEGGVLETPILDEPEGWMTDIPLSIRQAVESNSNRPVSAIILASDGRSMQVPGRSLYRLLRQESIPVLTLNLGSGEPILDVSVGDIRHPRRAFVRDSIPVLVNVSSQGASEGASVTVDLIDTTTNRKLESRSVMLSGEDDEVLLTARMDDPGIRKLVVEVSSDQPDLFGDNDRFEFEVDVVDRPIRVLYIEGYPRWEYRYLKNLLVRESSIESSVMLLSADREFAQEGNTPIARLPRSSEELEQFDLLIIGDVPAGFFSPEQLDLFTRQVAPVVEARHQHAHTRAFVL